MSRIVDIEPVITKLENTQKQNVHTFSKRELVDAIADIMNLKPIDAVPVIRCKDCKYYELDHMENVNGIPLIVAHDICKFWSFGCRTDPNGYCFMGEKVTE